MNNEELDNSIVFLFLGHEQVVGNVPSIEQDIKVCYIHMDRNKI